MRPHGRYLQFRHAFPEFFAPGIQAQRGLVRLRWLLLGNVDFRPLWTLGVSAGLVGLMLSMVLLVLPPGVQLSAATVTGLSPPAISIHSQRPPAAVESPATGPPFPSFNPAGPALLAASFTRLSMPRGWDDRRVGVTVSQPKEYVPPLFGGQPLNDGWMLAHARPASFPPAFAPYREPAGLRRWEPVTPKVLVSARGSSSIPMSAHPTVLVEKRADGAASPAGLLSYELAVTNSGASPVPDVNVFEALDVRRVTEVVPPALVEPNGLMWRLGGLAPGEQRKLTFTIAVDGLPQAASVTEVELADHFSAVISVAADSPYYGNPSPPGALPTTPRSSIPPGATPPRSSIPPGAQPPARNSIPPGAGAPRSSIPPGAQPPARSSIPAGATPPRSSIPAQPPAPQPQPPLRPILHLKSIPAEGGAVGDDVATWYEVTNTGDGPATDVLLTVELPYGLLHHDGTHTVYHRIARVAPGETRRAKLITRIETPGCHVLDARLAAGDVTARNVAELNVPRPAGGQAMFAQGAPLAEREIVQTELLSVPFDEPAPLWKPHVEAAAPIPPAVPEPFPAGPGLWTPSDAAPRPLERPPFPAANDEDSNDGTLPPLL